MHPISPSHNSSTTTDRHLLRTCIYYSAFTLLTFFPAFSQFTVARVSQNEWGLKNLSRIEIAQVSVIKTERGDSLLVYALRDTIPPPLPSSIREEVPRGGDDYYVISDFAYSQMNSLGGVFDTFQREPSSSTAGLSDTKDGDRALSFAFDKKKKGYCGLWIQLFNSFDPPQNRVYLDSRPFSALSFWIRGERGGEHLTLKIADARWIRKDDAVNVGEVGEFVRGGRIDTSWREAVIPLERIPASINRSQLGSLVLEADSTSKGRMELKALALCRDRMHTAPLTRANVPESLHKTRKSLWVWDSRTITESPERQNQFLDFLVHQEFTEVFLAIPYKPGEASLSGSLPVRHGSLDSLIAALHSRGIRVYALMGDKNFALPEWHAFVLSTVKNIGQFNAGLDPSKRFDGIHLDVEPYLLPGFNGPRHDELLRDYLELLSKVCSEAHGSNLTVGADIPFWYSEPDEFTHTVSTILFQGTEKPVYQHILDLVDNVAIMNYRTTSSGMDGIVAHSIDELRYAQQVGKTVFVGLETGLISDERIVTFRGRPQTGTITTSQGEDLFLVSSGDTLSFYLIAKRQFKDFSAFLRSRSIDQGSVYHWTTGTSAIVPGTRLSFATLGLQEFRRTMKETLLELSQYSSFSGFAIHHYSSYRRLLDFSNQ